MERGFSKNTRRCRPRRPVIRLNTLYRIHTAALLWLDISSSDLKQQDSAIFFMERESSKEPEKIADRGGRPNYSILFTGFTQPLHFGWMYNHTHKVTKFDHMFKWSGNLVKNTDCLPTEEAGETARHYLQDSHSHSTLTGYIIDQIEGTRYIAN